MIDDERLIEALKYDERIWRAFMTLKPIHQAGLLDALRAAASPVVPVAAPGKCYCCTCPEEYGQSDPYCRNHGHAGVRQCVKHASADKNQGTDEDGKPIATCQQVWAAKSWSKADAEVSP